MADQKSDTPDDVTDNTTERRASDGSQEPLAPKFTQADGAEQPLEQPAADAATTPARDGALGSTFDSATTSAAAATTTEQTRQREKRETAFNGFVRNWENRDHNGDKTWTNLPQISMSEAFGNLMDILGMLFSASGRETFQMMMADRKGDPYVDRVERFEETATAVRGGAVDRAPQEGRITYTTPDGRNLNIPLGERQRTVIAALEKVTASTPNQRHLLQAFWGAESAYGTKLVSEVAVVPGTGGVGDFQFIRGTWADTVNRRGTQMISNMRRDGYSAQADTLQGFIDRGNVGSSLSRHGAFLELRNDPVMASYGAYELIHLKSQTINADPNDKQDWGRIYMAYTAGEATVQAFNYLKQLDPTANIYQRLLNLTPQNSPYGQEMINGIKNGVRNNKAMFEVGNSTAAEIEQNYAARIGKHEANFSATFGPTSPNPTS